MVQPGNAYHLRMSRYPWTAADNGCFGGKWVEEKHLDWLDRCDRDRCLFAVAPDVYGDAVGSLERGARYFDLIRDMGFPVAVVAQDGAEKLPFPWDDFDVLFLGGVKTRRPRDEWKLSPAAESLARRARAHGKWVHMGRVSSLYRMKRAREMGCNSADGTFVKYRLRRRKGETDDVRESRGAAEIAAWLKWLDENPILPQPAEAFALQVHRDAAA